MSTKSEYLNSSFGVTYYGEVIAYDDTVTFPAINTVTSGVTYGYNGNELSGTLDAGGPNETDVRNGVVYGAKTGNLTLPIPAEVKLNVTYGANGTEYTGLMQGLYPVNPGGTIVGDKLTVIHQGLVNMILNMRNLDGYNYDYVSTQQEDLTKVSTYPHINVYQVERETSLDEIEMAGMNAYRNEAEFRLVCYMPASADTDNTFNIDSNLNNVLHDVKKVLGNYPTLDGLCEYNTYEESYKEIYGIGDDIFKPKRLVIKILVGYIQDVTEPNNNGYC